MHIVVIDASSDDIDRAFGGSVLAYDRQIHGKSYITAGNVSEMVDKILGKLRREPLHRLTIWGHGGPGQQGVGAGNSRFGNGDAARGLLICVVNGRLSQRSTLARLCGKFSWDARVDLHGCNVARGHSGRQLLRALCDLWQVPVRGGVNVQDSHADDRFDGPVIEAYPRAGRGSSVHVMHPGR
jgi:hypothetical protein